MGFLSLVAVPFNKIVILRFKNKSLIQNIQLNEWISSVLKKKSHLADFT